MSEESSGDVSQEPSPDEVPPSPPEEPPASEPTPTVGEIRLLNATRIPSGYQKMVRAKVEGHTCESMSLFTPVRMEHGLEMADGVVDVKDSPCVVLVLQNHGTTPVKLKKGCVLGNVVPVTEYSPGAPSAEAVVRDITAETDSTIRHDALLQQLDLKIDHLSAKEQQLLTDLILAYSDVFALDASELGTTTVVNHTIDTGDHHPIKQPLRRTPFALREKVDELVQGMLLQGVIQQSKSPWASPVVLVSKKDRGLRFYEV